MMNPQGLINGSKYLLYKHLQGGGTQLIGALTSNSSTFNREAIDITNKCSMQFREFIDGDEGLKTADHSCEVLYSSDAAYLEMRSDYLSGLISEYDLTFGGKSQTISFKVTSLADSAETDTVASSSVTLTSSDAFVQES